MEQWGAPPAPSQATQTKWDLAVPQRSPGLLLISELILAVLGTGEGGRVGAGREGMVIRVGVGLGGGGRISTFGTLYFSYE